MTCLERLYADYWWACQPFARTADRQRALAYRQMKAERIMVLVAVARGAA